MQRWKRRLHLPYLHKHGDGGYSIRFGENPAKPKDSNKQLAKSGVTPSEWWLPGAMRVNPDTLVGAKGLKVYREMRQRSPAVSSALEITDTARLSTDWDLVAGEGDRAEQMREFCKFVLENIDGTVIDFLKDLLDARPMGYSVIEKVPMVIDGGEWSGKWAFRRFAAKWPEDWEPIVDQFGDLTGMRAASYFTSSGDGQKTFEGDDFDRFIWYAPNREKGNWYGQSVLRPVYINYFSADVLSRQMNVAAEKGAGGTRTYGLKNDTFNANATAVRDEANETHGTVIEVYDGDNVDFLIVYPPGDFLDPLITAIQHHNGQIMQGIMVPQTIFSGTGASGEGGTQALGKQQFEGAFTLNVDRIGRSQEDTIDEDVLRQLCEWNFPNFQIEEMPRFKFAAFEDEDVLLRAKTLIHAKSLGLSIPVGQAMEDLGVREPEEGEEVLETGPMPDFTPGGGDEDEDEPEDTGEKFAEDTLTRQWDRALTRCEESAGGSAHFAEIEKKLDKEVESAVEALVNENEKIKAETKAAIEEAFGEKGVGS